MPAPARHILIISNYFAPDAGAAAVRNTRLAHALQQMGHQVTVLSSLPHYPQGQIHTGYRGKFCMVEDRDKVRVVQTWLWATASPRISHKLLSQVSFMLTALLRGVFLKRPDVILIEAQPIFTGLAGRLVAFFKRRPYVLNVSDLWPEHLLTASTIRESSWPYRGARALVNHIYRQAALIIAMSPGWSERIRALIGDRTRVETVLNGVELQRFHPDVDPAEVQAFRQQHNLTATRLVMFIGTFATQYDFALMFEAIAPLRDSADTQVVFIGKGSQQQVVETYCQDERFDHVRWIEWLPHADIPAAWNAATLTFWAMGPHTLYEGTIPAKVFEAMACGVPMVVVARGVMARLLEESETGIVVTDGGASALTAALRKLLVDDALRHRYTENARRYAARHFDHEIVAQRYEALLQEACS